MTRRTDVLPAPEVKERDGEPPPAPAAETFAPSATGTARRRWGGSTASTRDRYRIALELASGGMATVYLARRDAPGGFRKMVALKRVHQHMANDPESIQMFLDEARLASRIDHPNVCQVFDFGGGRGGLYIAMELLEGHVLSQVIRRAMEADKSGSRLFDSRGWRRVAVRLLVDAGEGLHAVHEATGIDGLPLNIVHRDVAPQNLFVTFDGTTKLLDLGIAHAEHRLTRTSTGVIKGHLAYVAPEQVRGQRIDRRADVWSLGVVAWETFAGRRLFRGANTAQTLFAIINDDIPRVETIRSGVPTAVSDVIGRALTRLPAERLGSTLAFSVALAEAAVDGIATRPEVSAFMDALFPDGRAKMRALVHEANRIADGLARREQGRRRAMRALVIGAGVAALGAAFGVGTLVAGSPARGSDDEEDAPQPEPVATRREPQTPASEEESAANTASREGAAGESTTDGVALADVAPDPTLAAPSADDGRDEEGSRTNEEDVPPAAARGPGEIRVAVEGMRGWARVRLGNRDLGRTPFARRVPSGRHVLRVTFDDGSTQRVPVRIQPARTTAVSLRRR